MTNRMSAVNKAASISNRATLFPLLQAGKQLCNMLRCPGMKRLNGLRSCATLSQATCDCLSLSSHASIFLMWSEHLAHEMLSCAGNSPLRSIRGRSNYTKLANLKHL